jgi:hypothetical protein
MQQTQESKVAIAIVLTAIVVGIGSYYFWGSKSTSVNTVKSEASSFTKSSKEYAVMGREVWSAFGCASLASISGDSAEAERLFTFGHEQGKTFIGALNAQKIENEDISQQVPVGLVWLLRDGGPSEDFILGRVFENAQEDALEDVFKTNGEYNSDDMQKTIAKNNFVKQNCQLIGK